jgi:hypothetical protein
MFRGLIREHDYLLISITMKSNAVKNQIFQYIDRVDDDNFLIEIKNMLEERLKLSDNFSQLTDEDRKIIAHRKEMFLSGKEESYDAFEAGKELLKLFDK